jgi:type 2 lantibiotic biosynthesis protein LanM
MLPQPIRPFPSFLARTSWHRAATLTERARSLQAMGLPNSDTLRDDAERGRRRLERWRAQTPFGSDGIFQARLAQAGLTQEQFLRLLSDPADSPPGHPTAPPPWAVEVDRAFAHPEHADLPSWPDHLVDRPELGLLEVVRPLLGRYVARLRDGIVALAGRWPDVPFDARAVDRLLFRSLPGGLLGLLSRTLVLELHVARLRRLLPGESTSERFRQFVAHLSEPETALDLFAEYPVLTRQVVIRLDHWLATSLEFLERCCADWPALCAAFSPDHDPGPLVEVQANAGDAHRGRSVQILRFASGLRVVYKPKPLAVDQHFQELLGWLNDRGVATPFRQLLILDRGAYGWVEFVSPADCSSRDEAARFYRRTGGYLAVLYALAGADFHDENLIAVGEHPVLVDLEALFHPRTPREERGEAGRVANHLLDESVLGPGLLPQRSRFEGESGSFDLSGIGGEAGGRLPWSEGTFEDRGTDEMRFVRRPGVIEATCNRPTLHGAAVKPLDFLADVEAGFVEVYELLAEGRVELLAGDGPLTRFAQDEVRIILRPTSRYSELLIEGTHPDVLRDALDRDRLFDRLWEIVQHRPELAPLVPAEIEALWQGDIPLFTTRPDSRDLWAGADQRFAGLLTVTGMHQLRERLERFGRDDLSRQLWLLRASLTTLAAAREGGPTGYHLVEGGPAADRDRLLAASRAIADELAGRAIHGGHGDVTWIGLALAKDEQWELSPLGMDLYDGLPGLALFLAYLGNVVNEERYTLLARKTLETVRRQLDASRRQHAVTGIGAFAGWGGILYALAHLGVSWREPDLLAFAVELTDELPPLIEKDDDHDLLGGSAGCIVALSCLDRCQPTPSLRRLAIQCGDHLLARARSMRQGLGWPSPFPCSGPLTGFSHGAAGISWALLELAAWTGDERFRSAALGGIAYERSQFSPEANNWPDLRLPDSGKSSAEAEPPSFFNGWCHGAPGIGLARLLCLPHLDDPLLRPEIEAACFTTLVGGFGRNHTLCHGDLGNLELPLEAARAFPNSAVSGRVDALAAGILRSVEADGGLCGNATRVASPGLMTGLAGIGYGLLRLAEPARVPSVLTLTPPRDGPVDRIGNRPT